MTTTWIVAADASRARVLQVADREQRLLEIEDLLNPQGRLQDRELQTAAEPRFSGHGGLGKPGASSTSGPGSDLSWINARDLEAWFAKVSERAP